MAEKLLGLLFFWQSTILLGISPKPSSTLILVFFTISVLLSKWWLQIFFNSCVSFTSMFCQYPDCFKAFSYRTLTTIVQSPDLVYRILNSEVNSFVIKLVIDVIRAMLFVAFNNDKVGDVIAEHDLLQVSVKIRSFSVFKTFFMSFFDIQ